MHMYGSLYAHVRVELSAYAPQPAFHSLRGSICDWGKQLRECVFLQTQRLQVSPPLALRTVRSSSYRARAEGS
jgi:hypothetical protein